MVQIPAYRDEKIVSAILAKSGIDGKEYIHVITNYGRVHLLNCNIKQQTYEWLSVGDPLLNPNQ